MSSHTALTAAASKGYLDVVQLLLQDARTDVNMQGCGSDTALIAAARNGVSLDVVQLLLQDARTDVNIQGSGSDTTLTAAARRDHFDVVQHTSAGCTH